MLWTDVVQGQFVVANQLSRLHQGWDMEKLLLGGGSLQMVWDSQVPQLTCFWTVGALESPWSYHSDFGLGNFLIIVAANTVERALLKFPFTLFEWDPHLNINPPFTACSCKVFVKITRTHISWKLWNSWLLCLDSMEFGVSGISDTCVLGMRHSGSPRYSDYRGDMTYHHIGSWSAGTPAGNTTSSVI